MSLANPSIDNNNYSTLSCVLLPLYGFDILLPKSLVKEVVYKPYVTNYEGDDDWLIGDITWQDIALPLISFEQLSNQQRNARSTHQRAVICHVLDHAECFPNYAIEVQSMPRPLILDSRALQPHEGMLSKHSEVISHYVKIGSKELGIPNFEILESMLVSRAE